MSDQYLRAASLIVSAGTKGLDLSQLRFTFKTNAADVQSPNTAAIRVYNLSDATVAQVQKEYTAVTLQAGYQNGNFGIIFQGTIKQFGKGRESATDTFLDIFAADGDLAYNMATVNATVAAGASVDQKQAVVQQAFGANGTQQGDTSALAATGGILPRGKVLYGMARDSMRGLATQANSRWSIQDGKVVVVPLTGYLPGEAIVLNAKTGVIGIPEATADGIKVKTLLNPMVRIGTRVQMNNGVVNSQTVREQGGYPTYNSINLPASISTDGFYRVLVAEHEGDTRGNPWYTDLICLALDNSAPAAAAAKAYP